MNGLVCVFKNVGRYIFIHKNNFLSFSFQNSSRRFDDDESKVVLDRDFILDCLCWHNEYRARHESPALTISNEVSWSLFYLFFRSVFLKTMFFLQLCEKAQRWADKLAASNEFYYKTNEKTLGQNLFCCPANNVLTDLTGQEVASYWYKEVKKYDFFKETSLLHTNVNTGHFTQMIWCASRYFGVGKAFSKTGKMFVVAFYFPCGNIVDKFQVRFDSFFWFKGLYLTETFRFSIMFYHRL